MLTKRDLLRSAALAALTASTAKSVPVQAQTSADRPGFFKAKDIAEAGFLRGQKRLSRKRRILVLL